ncbi:unnamed protein product [Eretmochelys imbricata]
MPPTGSKEPFPQGAGRGWNWGRCGSPPPAIPHHLKQSLLLQINALHYVCGTAAFLPPRPAALRASLPLQPCRGHHATQQCFAAHCLSAAALSVPWPGEQVLLERLLPCCRLRPGPQPFPEMTLSWKGERAALCQAGAAHHEPVCVLAGLVPPDVCTAMEDPQPSRHWPGSADSCWGCRARKLAGSCLPLRQDRRKGSLRFFTLVVQGMALVVPAPNPESALFPCGLSHGRLLRTRVSSVSLGEESPASPQFTDGEETKGVAPCREPVTESGFALGTCPSRVC